MRRSITVMLAGLALLASAAPAQATTRVPFVGPARSYELVGVCPFTISAQERAGHPGYLTLDDNGEVVQVQFRAPSTRSCRARSVSSTFESIGSTVVTANGDGTWTMVQKGSGLAVVPASDPEGPKLVWFTGARDLHRHLRLEGRSTFVPQSQVRSGIDSNVCEMLVTGLKTRHDAF